MGYAIKVLRDKLDSGLIHIECTYVMFDGQRFVKPSEFCMMSNWGSHQATGAGHRYDPRAKEMVVVCPHCKAEMRVWLKEGDCIVDCPAWGCKKSFVIKERIREEYR